MLNMKSIVAVLLFVMIGFGGAEAFAAGVLDGKSFGGSMGDKGSAAAKVADDFVFKEGKFTSTLCSRFGYHEADYTALGQNEAVNFKAHCTSGSGGVMDWTGVVKGDQIEGTVVSQESGTTSESWFKGTLKGKAE